MPTFPVILAGSRITAGLLTSMQPVVVTKPADQSVTSSTVLVNDNSLVVPNLLASATYQFQCLINYEGGTRGAADFKWIWTLPSAATMLYSVIYRDTSGNVHADLSSNGGTTVAGSNGAGALLNVTMLGSVTISSTPGSLQLQWAQGTSSGTATKVHAGSTLQLQRSP